MANDTVPSAEALAVHSAELALHDAHASHNDEWVKAANERLHQAVEAYCSVATRVCPGCGAAPAADGYLFHWDDCTLADARTDGAS